MADGISFDSPRTQRELLDRLAAFGKEWRESKFAKQIVAATSPDSLVDWMQGR